MLNEKDFAEYMMKARQILDGPYVSCVKNTLSAAFHARWKERAFEEFVRMDMENTVAVKERDGKTHPPITDRKKSFESFDLQACNKTLLHLEDARAVLLDYLHIDFSQFKPWQRKDIESHLKGLLNYRNDDAHRGSAAVSQKESLEQIQEALGHACSIMKYFFHDVADPAHPGKTYYEEIKAEKYGLDTILQKVSNRFADYFKPNMDDLLLLKACFDLNIECKTEGSEKFFLSPSPEDDAKRIYNHYLVLLQSKNSQSAKVSPQTTHSSKKRTTLFVLAGVLLGVGIIAALIAVFSSRSLSTGSEFLNKPEPSNAFDSYFASAFDEWSSKMDALQNTQEGAQNTGSSGDSNATTPDQVYIYKDDMNFITIEDFVGNCQRQIKLEMRNNNNDDHKAYVGSDLNLGTLDWRYEHSQSCSLYSEDPEIIRVADDGLSFVPVSPGTTYVVVSWSPRHPDSYYAYKVTVIAP